MITRYYVFDVIRGTVPVCHKINVLRVVLSNLVVHLVAFGDIEWTGQCSFGHNTLPVVVMVAFFSKLVPIEGSSSIFQTLHSPRCPHV